jgi:hypothetical protein
LARERGTETMTYQTDPRQSRRSPIRRLRVALLILFAATLAFSLIEGLRSLRFS